ncbi:hypothetical protein BDR22DRAFT_816552 [Usnea florida]
MHLQAIFFTSLACILAVTASPAAAPFPYRCPGAPDQCFCNIAGYTPTAGYGDPCSAADCASGHDCHTDERCPCLKRAAKLEGEEGIVIEPRGPVNQLLQQFFGSVRHTNPFHERIPQGLLHFQFSQLDDESLQRFLESAVDRDVCQDIERVRANVIY